MRSEGSDGRDDAGAAAGADRELWRLSQTATVEPDGAEQLLDLAAFADGRLDADDAERVAARLAQDSDAAADVAAARAAAEMAASVDAAIVERAVALVEAPAAGNAVAQVVPFTPPRTVERRLPFAAAGWSGLVAATVLAGWLGFDLGRGFYDLGLGGGQDASASELIDPGRQMLRDFGETSQI